MEFRLRPLGVMEFFLQNNNHQAVNKKFSSLSDDCGFAKNSMIPRGRSLNSMELNIYI